MLFQHLEMKNICKRFPGVIALDGVDFDLLPGEVHTLVGENGAGKSTLIKTLFGDYVKDAGEIRLDGRVINMNHPGVAKRLGMLGVQQHFSLIPTMSVAENLFFGDYPCRVRGVIDWRQVHDRAVDLLRSIGFEGIDPGGHVCDLSVAERQKVEIAKAVRQEPRILIMDEPSSVLPKTDLSVLYRILDGLKARGVGIIYISHHFEEIFRISDRITVLKDGRKVRTLRTADTCQDELVSLMVGRDIGEMYPRRKTVPGETILTVKGLCSPALTNISFTLRRGEVLGVSGLVGAGRTDLCEALFGLCAEKTGVIALGGREIRNKSPLEAIRNGFGYVTEDRHKTGLILTMPVMANISFAGLNRVSRLGFIDRKTDREVAEDYVRRLNIVTPGIRQLVRFLSGGNQQKVVLSKWLFTEPNILILDEPTRGIDVGAKVEIYKLINGLLENGLAVIMVSSELPEILGMSDRILVMRGGSVVGEFLPGETDEEELVACASGLEYCRRPQPPRPEATAA